MVTGMAVTNGEPMSQPPPPGEAPREPQMTGISAAPAWSPVAEGPTMPGFTGNRPIPPVPAASSARKPAHRRRWWIISGIVVVVLAVGTGITWWLWPSGTHVVPGTVQASVVSADDVS